MPLPIEKLLRKAKQHVSDGTATKAEDIYNHILSQYPKNKKAIQGLAKLRTLDQASINNLMKMFINNKFQEAIMTAQELSGKFPNAPILYEILGASYMHIGKDENTVKYYKKLLSLQPKHTDALNNSGMVYYKLKEFESAADLYQKVVEIEPSFADAHYNLGNAFRKLNSPRKACQSYKKSLELNPDDVEVLINYGHALRDYGAFADANEIFSKALKINPNLAGIRTEIDSVSRTKMKIDQHISGLKKALNSGSDAKAIIFCKAAIYEESGYFETAIDCNHDLLELELNSYKANLNLGRIFSKTGDHKSAIKHLNQSIKTEPNSETAHYLLGNSQMEEGQLEAALESCRTSLKIKPEWAGVINLMGIIQKKRGCLDAALENFEKAVCIDPDLDSAFNNMGATQYELGNLDAAIESHKRAAEINPEYAIYQYNLASMQQHSGDFEAALENYEKALEKDPLSKKVNFHQSLTYLANEDFKNGWAKYEWRWTAKDNMNFLPSIKEIWQPGIKKRVLLWAEQGLGDEIMYASIISELHALCSKLIVQIDERLIPLFQRSFPDDIDFRSKDKRVSETEYDEHVPIGSLPKYFRQNIKSFKYASRGWLTACKFKTNSLRDKLIEDGSEVLIGISWHSTVPRIGAEAKVVSLVELAKKLHGPKIKLVNLQYGDVSEEFIYLKEKTNIEVVQLHEIDNKNDVDGLAALIMACDRIVSISNLTIHLAGALGKQSDVMLAFSSDWRWGKGQDSTYWYDSVRLHRQTKINGWTEVIEQL